MITRPRFVFMLVVVALALAIVTGSVFSAPLTLTPLTTPTPAPAHIHFGVWQANAAQRDHSQRVRKIGAGWTRVDFSWASVEPTPGVYDWTGVDAHLSEVLKQGYDVALSIVGNPSWAAASFCGPLYADRYDEYANFAREAVLRYSNPPYNIRYFDLGNEPDNADPVNYGWVGGCWGKGHPNSLPGAGGGAYAELLKAAYPAMKQANPNIFVGPGALAYDSWLSEGGPFDEFFLDDLLAAGGGNYFDVINFHYYDGFAYKWGSVIGKAAALQNKVELATGVKKPLIITEMGRASVTPAGPNPDPDREEEQARFVMRGYTQAISFPIYPIIWFQDVDNSALSGGYSYGLLHEGLQAKPAYTAYKTMACELYDLRFSEKATLPGTLEGYVYSNGSQRKTFLWSKNSNTITQSFALITPTDTLRVVNKLGEASLITDGSAQDLDAAVNGTVAVGVTGSPVVVESVNCDLPPAPPTDLRLRLFDDNDLRLGWTPASNNRSYKIWRSAAPYAASNPDLAPPTDTACQPVYDDFDVRVGNPPPNQFYYISAANACGGNSALSNPIGAFYFALQPGG